MTAYGKPIQTTASPALHKRAHWWQAVANWLDLNLGRLSARGQTLPPIVLGRSERDELNLLAMVDPGHDASVSDILFYELDRAQVVPDGELEEGIARMGSIVHYSTEAGSEHRVRIVYPHEADADAGKVSVLSPVGAALIGLRKSQSFPLTAPDGQRTTLTVVSVAGPFPDRSRARPSPS